MSMRFYETQLNGSIKPVDFQDPSLTLPNGKIIFHLDENGNPFYKVAFSENNVIHLYDIRMGNIVGLTGYYRVYDPITSELSDASQSPGKHFTIPDNFKLTEQQLKFLRLLNKAQAIKNEFARVALLKPASTFHDLFLQKYHDIAVSNIEQALLTGNIDQLKNALQEHWEKINGTSAAYTALPNDPVTFLFCDIAEFLAEEIKQNKTKDTPNISAIALLMPTVATESQFPDSFNNLNTMKARDIVRTHILGPKGMYLVPVGILASLALGNDKQNAYPSYQINNLDPYRLASPYADDDHNENHFLDSDTVQQLTTFSAATQALFDAKNQYTQLADVSDNLLGQLIRFVNLLKFGSAHGGVGKPEEAANIAFIAIDNFYQYYITLPDKKKNEIPKNVKEVIDNLLKLASPTKDAQGHYIDRTHELTTCIGTTSEALDKAMKEGNNQAILATISISGESKEQALHNMSNLFSHNQEEIRRGIENKLYYGKDPLGMTNALLSFLHLSDQYHIQNEKGLNEFLKLPKKEMMTLFEKISHLKLEIKTAIGDLENLVMLFLRTSDDGIKALFEAMSSDIVNTKNGIIKNNHDLKAFLQPFENTPRINFILNVLSTVIQNGDQLIALLSNDRLTEPQRTQILDAVKDNLNTLIQNGHQLSWLLSNNRLTEPQRTQILNAVNDKLSTLIQNGYQLNGLLSIDLLTEPQRTQILNAVNDKLSTLIQDDGYELYRLLLNTQLTEPQRMQILEAVKNILTEKQYTKILNKNVLSKIVISSEQLNDIIGTYSTTAKFFHNPEPELSALKSLCNYGGKGITLQQIVDKIKGVSKEKGAVSHREDLLRDPNSHPEDKTGVSNVIRKMSLSRN